MLNIYIYPIPLLAIYSREIKAKYIPNQNHQKTSRNVNTSCNENS